MEIPKRKENSLLAEINPSQTVEENKFIVDNEQREASAKSKATKFTA